MDVARIMMIEENVSHVHWKKEGSTIIYTLNGFQIKEGSTKTTYELRFGYAPIVRLFIIFGSEWFIKRDDEVGKFDSISDEGIFLGYSTKSKIWLRALI